MNTLNVISINPGETARGVLSPGNKDVVCTEVLNESPVLYRRTQSSFRKFTDFVTGIDNHTGTSLSKKLLIARMILGSLIGAYGVFIQQTAPDSLLPLVCIAIGISIATGLFTRTICFGATCLLGYHFWENPNNPELMRPEFILPVAMSLVFTIVGPGYYSMDQLIRKLILNVNKAYSRHKAEKLAADRLSYRAFRYHP